MDNEKWMPGSKEQTIQSEWQSILGALNTIDNRLTDAIHTIDVCLSEYPEELAGSKTELSEIHNTLQELIARLEPEMVKIDALLEK